MRWLVVVLAVACSAPQHHPPMPADNTAPTWFRGVWKREWMKRGDAAPEETRIVRDVQTPSIYGSVRIPLARPKITARSFAELDDAQLHVLLEQKGFAGTAMFAGSVATWRHDIDFEPPGDTDTARLSQRTPTTVLEEALDGGFSELWWNLAPGETRFLGIEERRAGRALQVLSVVGDHFVYARNRPHDLPPADSLMALAAGKSRAEIVALLGCEVSYGRVHGGAVPWEIVHSTLPWREGTSLDAAAVRAAGKELVSTFAAEDLAIMFAGAR